MGHSPSARPLLWLGVSTFLMGLLGTTFGIPQFIAGLIGATGYSTATLQIIFFLFGAMIIAIDLYAHQHK